MQVTGETIRRVFEQHPEVRTSLADVSGTSDGVRVGAEAVLPDGAAAPQRTGVLDTVGPEHSACVLAGRGCV